MRVEPQREALEMARVHHKFLSNSHPRRPQASQPKMDSIFTMETILLLMTDRHLQRMVHSPPR